MATLEALYKTLHDFDYQGSDHSLEGKAYHLSYNSHLGFASKNLIGQFCDEVHKEPGATADFHVGLPFHDWDNDSKNVHFQSKLAIEFKDTLAAGVGRLAK